jgi:hypothetical protein
VCAGREFVVGGWQSGFGSWLAMMAVLLNFVHALSVCMLTDIWVLAEYSMHECVSPFRLPCAKNRSRNESIGDALKLVLG